MVFNHFSLVASLALASLVQAEDNPAVHGPPKGADPLTYGFYATPETRKPIKLEVQGNFPSWVSGSLYRGAAGTWDSGNYTAEHWFDGFSRNHKFEISNGEVFYQSRNSSDEVKDFVAETGKYPNGNFGSDPCKIIFGAFETQFRDGKHLQGDVSTDSVSVSFMPNFPGLNRNSTNKGAPFLTLVATTDANTLQQIDPVDLNPIEIFTYQAENLDLVNDGRSAAHPAFSSDGGYYNYVLDTSTSPPEYRVFGILPSGETKILARFDDAPPAYLHQTFNTENYIVLVVWQADLTQQGKNLVESIAPWDSKRKTLFYVIDREQGGVTAKYESEDAFFAFHQTNSFEDESGDIMIDLPTMKDHSFLKAANVISLRANLGPNRAHGKAQNDIAGAPTRYRLPSPSKSTKKVRTAEKVISMPYKKANIELPRINPEYAQKPYQYAYGIHVEKPGYFADSLIKLDMEMQGHKVWMPETLSVPSEPIFVASPNATCEDDGVLLSVVMDSSREKSSLVVIDAKNMEELGRAHLPIVMGYGFHGVWGSSM